MSVIPAQMKLNPHYQRLALAAAVFFLLVVVFGRTIQREFLVYLIIRANAPDAAVVQDLIDQSSSPAGLLRRLWKSHKIPHRLLVMGYLNNAGTDKPDLIRQMNASLIEAATDVDLSIRESALAILATANHPDLVKFAQRQLRDVDPEIRLLGLRYLRTKGDQRLARIVAPLLDDAEPQVAVAAANALRTWTGNDFGVRSHLVVAHEDQDGARKIDPAKLEAATQGLRLWKDWWKVHENEYPSVAATDAAASALLPRLPAKNFALEDLAGQRFQLSDFKGKIVLLNFWTTWCTACWTEIPDLIELQRQHPELVILGISLDGQPDQHDHSSAAEEAHRGESGNEAKAPANVAEIREKVQQFVKAKGINYRVLLNPSGEVGALFNGHELPTNILIDAEGYIRRRFIGGRAPAQFGAMIDNIGATHFQTR